MIINSNAAPYNTLPSAAVRHGKHAARAGKKASSSVSDGDALQASGDNLTVDPQIQDADAANAIAGQVRKSVLSQPSTAMLAQAQLIPQKALQLLQQ